MLSVSEAAREAATSLAVIAGDERLTFADLSRKIQGLAQQLVKLAPHPGQAIAFVATPTLDSLLLCHALLELGRTALPLNPRLLASDHLYLIEQANALEVTFDSGVLHVTRKASHFEFNAEQPPPAVLIATSGSTGQPRLVRLSHGALIAAAKASADRLGWNDDDRWLLSLSLCHIGGLSIATRCLIARRPIVLGVPRGDPAELTNVIKYHEVTLVSLVSTQLHRLLAGDFDLKNTKLRVLLLGGMRTDPWLVGAARARGIPVLTTYGMTETSSQVATQLRSDLRSLIGPCHDVGPPLAGIEVKIVGEEIAVKGPVLMDGYVGDSQGFDSNLGPVPNSSLRDGWFHTGDWGRLDTAGRLTIMGRAVDRIVTSGENVAPAEVELVLEALPSIERACVFGVPDAVRGEQVAVAVVLREGHEFNWPDFTFQVTERLASFKRPRALAIVSEFEMTATGKLDRPATARMAATRLRIFEPGR